MNIYSKEVMDHLMNPQNAHRMPDAPKVVSVIHLVGTLSESLLRSKMIGSRISVILFLAAAVQLQLQVLRQY